MDWFVAAAWGCVGALVRSIMGLIKALTEGRKILWKFFALTLVQGVVVGAVLGVLLPVDIPLYVFLAGVGGTHLLESATKILKISPIKIGK